MTQEAMLPGGSAKYSRRDKREGGSDRAVRRPLIRMPLSLTSQLRRRRNFARASNFWPFNKMRSMFIFHHSYFATDIPRNVQKGNMRLETRWDKIRRMNCDTEPGQASQLERCGKRWGFEWKMWIGIDQVDSGLVSSHVRGWKGRGTQRWAISLYRSVGDVLLTSREIEPDLQELPIFSFALGEFLRQYHGCTWGRNDMCRGGECLWVQRRASTECFQYDSNPPQAWIWTGDNQIELQGYRWVDRGYS